MRPKYWGNNYYFQWPLLVGAGAMAVRAWSLNPPVVEFVVPRSIPWFWPMAYWLAAGVWLIAALTKSKRDRLLAAAIFTLISMGRAYATAWMIGWADASHLIASFVLVSFLAVYLLAMPEPSDADK